MVRRLQEGAVKLNPETHQYFDENSKEYRSVSKLVRTVIPPFEKEKISRIMASNMAKQSGASVDYEQKKLLAQWQAKGDSSIIHGNRLHDALEEYVLTGRIENPDLAKLKQSMSPFLKRGYKYFPEQVIYSRNHFVAGMADLVVMRQRSNNSLFDIFDYKTNEAKGIQFDSISYKNDIVKHYNKFLLPPVDHLEDCNYNHYSLQISIYARMLSDTFGAKIGRLAILFVNKDLTINEIPINYLYHDAGNLLETSKKLKDLNEIGKDYEKGETNKEGRADNGEGERVFTDDW